MIRKLLIASIAVAALSVTACAKTEEKAEETPPATAEVTVTTPPAADASATVPAADAAAAGAAATATPPAAEATATTPAAK